MRLNQEEGSRGRWSAGRGRGLRGEGGELGQTPLVLSIGFWTIPYTTFRAGGRLAHMQDWGIKKCHMQGWGGGYTILQTGLGRDGPHSEGIPCKAMD